MASTMTSADLQTLPYPQGDGELELRVEAGACRLHVTAGEGGAWVTTRFRDPSRSINLDATVNGNRGLIRVGRSPADLFGFVAGVPELTLELGRLRPFRLSVATGASENRMEFGGLPITGLEIKHGAGMMDVHVSTPTVGHARQLKFGVGAGKTSVYGLGNVDFEEVVVEGGAASCVLDFSGSALRNGSVRVSTAMAGVELRIPEQVPTEVISESVLGRPDADGGFDRRGGAWLNRAALTRPVALRVRSSMVMGQLKLCTIG